MTITATEIKAIASKNGIHAAGCFAAVNFDRCISIIRDTTQYYAMACRSLYVFYKAGHVPDEIHTIVVFVMDYFVESSDHSDGY